MAVNDGCGVYWEITMGNIQALPGCRNPSPGPNLKLIGALESLLDRAKSGDLQSFVGTGFTAGGLRLSCLCDSHYSVYEMLGALAWLQAEYVQRQTS